MNGHDGAGVSTSLSYFVELQALLHHFIFSILSIYTLGLQAPSQPV